MFSPKKCLTLESKVRELVQRNNIVAEVEKVTDLNTIMNYSIGPLEKPKDMERYI